MTKLLSELPDSKNPMARWFEAGLKQMTIRHRKPYLVDLQTAKVISLASTQLVPNSNLNLIYALLLQCEMKTVLKNLG